MARKQAKVKHRPSSEKKPKASYQNNLDSRHLSWRFSKADRGGKWAWSKLGNSPNNFCEVIEKLQDFETMNWPQIEMSGSHPINVEEISKEARKRLTEVGKENVVDIVSFHITAKERVWCVRVKSSIMEILWWDPKHWELSLNLTNIIPDPP